jgi:hypothetical protein
MNIPKFYSIFVLKNANKLRGKPFGIREQFRLKLNKDEESYIRS